MNSAESRAKAYADSQLTLDGDISVLVSSREFNAHLAGQSDSEELERLLSVVSDLQSRFAVIRGYTKDGKIAVACANAEQFANKTLKESES